MSSKYPMLDIDGDIPVVIIRNDPDYILSNNPGRCWWCGKETFLVDLNWQGYFCGSWIDEHEIDADLERRNKGPHFGSV